MKIISMKQRILIILIKSIFLLLFFTISANAQFKKIEDLMIGCRYLSSFQKHDIHYLAAGDANTVSIYKWNSTSFEFYQFIMLADYVYYDSITIFKVNNENYFILSGPIGFDIYLWNEAEEQFTSIQNIPIYIPLGASLEYFILNDIPCIAIPSVDNKVWVYKWNGTQFADMASFICPGANIKSVNLNNNLYLIASFFETPSKVYKWNGMRFMISNDFQVPLENKQLAHSFNYNEEQFFVFFTSYFTQEQGDTFEINLWNGEQLEKVYLGTTNAYLFDSVTVDNKQFIAMPDVSNDVYFENIYELKDNKCIPYQTIPNEFNNEYFSHYLKIDGKTYFLMCRYFSNISLYEWESSEQISISLSDIICALKVLTGENCKYNGPDFNADNIVDIKEAIYNMSELGK